MWRKPMDRISRQTRNEREFHGSDAATTNKGRYMTTDDLQLHVNESIERAYRGESNLNPAVLGIKGFSTTTQRHLLNNIASKLDFYLEVGLFRGATFCNRLLAFLLLISVNLAFGQNGGSLGGASGGGGGSPAGSTNQIQYNNAGTFGASSNFTVNPSTAQFIAPTTSSLIKDSKDAKGATVGYSPNYSFSDRPTSGLGPIDGFGAGVGIYVTGNLPLSLWSWGAVVTNLVFASSATNAAASPLDVALSRNAAGVLEVNNGTPGTFQDFKARNVIATGAVTGKGSVPVGGASNKALIKLSAADYDVGWGLPATMVLSPVSIPAGAKSLVVKNPAIGSESTVFCSVRSDDKTAQIKNVVSGKGSFTVNLSTAPTAETSLGVFVVNPAQ
jgi:hypothetical protein